MLAHQLRNRNLLRGGKQVLEEGRVEEIEQTGYDQHHRNHAGHHRQTAAAVPFPPFALRFGLLLLAARGLSLMDHPAERRVGHRLEYLGPFRHRLRRGEVEHHVGVLPKFLQIGQHVGGRLVAAVHRGAHGVHRDLLQTLGDVGIHLPGLDRGAVDVLDGHRHRRLAVEGGLAGQHLVHDHPQRIEVGPLVHPAASGLLGRDIVDRAERLAGQGALGRGDAGDAEIGHLDAAVL